MKEFNWKKIAIHSLGLLFSGILALILQEKNLGFALSCSSFTSFMSILLYDFFVAPKEKSIVDEWKLTKIYNTRAEKNADSDPNLSKLQYKLDCTAFGLKAFRERMSSQLEDCLRRGVNIRIITMEPDSPFVAQREREENEANGQIKKTINNLVEWADNLNSKGYKGKIVIKGYSCMTLDFYWRMDSELYFGPYWFGESSRETVTYKYERGGKGFDRYTDYFERLWEKGNFKQLTATSA